MSPPSPPVAATAPVRRAARALAPACAVLAVLLPSAVLLQLTRGWPAPLLAGLPAGVSLAGIAPGRLVLATALLLAPVLLLALALWRARSAFRAMAEGRGLTQVAVQALRGFAGLGLLSAVASLAVPTAVGLLLSWGAAGGTVLTLSFGSQPLTLLVFAALTWQLARVLQEALSIADEHAQFV